MSVQHALQIEDIPVNVNYPLADNPDSEAKSEEVETCSWREAVQGEPRVLTLYRTENITFPQLYWRVVVNTCFIGINKYRLRIVCCRFPHEKFKVVTSGRLFARRE